MEYVGVLRPAYARSVSLVAIILVFVVAWFSVLIFVLCIGRAAKLADDQARKQRREARRTTYSGQDPKPEERPGTKSG